MCPGEKLALLAPDWTVPEKYLAMNRKKIHAVRKMTKTNAAWIAGERKWNGNSAGAENDRDGASFEKKDAIPD
jgi:hypothetical protein